MREIADTLTGSKYPVVSEYSDVVPLSLMGKEVVNGRGRVMSNDEWVYVGGHAINVNRANYCRKRNLMQISIAESIGGKPMSVVLQEFIMLISDKIVVVDKYWSDKQIISFNL